MLSKGKLAVVLATALAIGGIAVPGKAGGAPTAGAGGGRLEIFYTPPVLVRAGERVRVPVDVVCATANGKPCPATLTVGASVEGEAWRTARVPAGAGLRMDFTAPAARALTVGVAAGTVRFYLRAGDSRGRVASLGSATAPLSFYVTPSMSTIDVPAIPFGRVRPGRSLLSLPWGTGSKRAGIALGNQSPTVGPSAFDVDARGRVYLLDELQERVAVFAGGRLVRQTRIAAASPADIAVASDGTAYVLSRVPRTPNLVARAIDPAGRTRPARVLGSGIPGEIRSAGRSVFVHLYPLDEWVPVPVAAGSPETSGSGSISAGRPLAGGDQLLSVVSHGAVRLGTLIGNAIRDAVELRFSQAIGELALVEPDGDGGYWAIVHVWRGGPNAADQYQVIHAAGGRVDRTYAVPSGAFALSAALSRFRLGADGALYQLRTSPEGMSIVRYRAGGVS